jgi:hypothetical protein
MAGMVCTGSPGRQGCQPGCLLARKPSRARHTPRCSAAVAATVVCRRKHPLSLLRVESDLGSEGCKGVFVLHAWPRVAMEVSIVGVQALVVGSGAERALGEWAAEHGTAHTGVHGPSSVQL